MKKVAIILGSLVALIIVLLLVIPLFVNVDKYRPQIEAAIEENLNAEAEIGKLSLNLWGGVNVGIERLVIYEKGVKQTPVLSTKDAKLAVKLFPMLAGKFIVTLKVDGPEINVVKGRDGKMNVMRLMKPSQTPAPTDTKAEEGSGPGKGGAAVASGADISLEIKDGKINYADQLTGTKTGLSGLSLGLYHVGANKPINIKFQSSMDVKGIKDLTLSGKADLNGTIGAYMKAEGLDRFTAELKLDASDLVIKYGTLFNKEDGVSLRVDTKLVATPDSLNLEKLLAELNSLDVNINGTVKNFDSPVLDLHIKSSKFVLTDWKNVIGMLGDFNAEGTASFDVKVSGPTSNIKINGGVQTKDIALKLAALREPITNLNTDLKFTEDAAKLNNFSMNIGKSDIVAKGSVKNFNKPHIDVDVTSKLFDMDAMLPEKTAEQKKAEADAAKNKKEMTDEEIEKMATGPVNSIRKNEFLRGVNLNAKALFSKIRMNKADITDLRAQMLFSDLVFTLKDFTAKAFTGSANGFVSMDFKPLHPIYKVSGGVDGIDINAAITSQMETLKDTVMGKTYAKFDISGSGVTKARVKTNMGGRGNFRLEGGSWSALKVLQQIGEKASAIPGAKEKLGGVVISGKIRKATSDFTIGGGRFNILNLIADLEEANTGLTGEGFVDFDKNLSLQGRILAPVSGVPGDMKHSDGRASIVYEIGCTVTGPCFKSEATVKQLANAYGKEEARKAAKQGIQKLKESVKDERAKQILDKVDEKTVEDVLKKFKF